MDFILILVISLSQSERKKIKMGWHQRVFVLATTVFCFYFSLSNMFYYLKKYNIAKDLYPAYTLAYVHEITEAATADEMNEIADKILKYNKNISVAYSAKSRYYFYEGDILKMVAYKKKAIHYSKYDIEEYDDYYIMLSTARELYLRAGDTLSALYCEGKIDEIDKMLKELEKSTSSIAYKIDDKPSFELNVMREH